MGLAGVPTKVIKGPDAVEEMAPALTEPLSQSKLSPSAASAGSPRGEVETSSTQEDVPTSVSTDSGAGTASSIPSETDVTVHENTTATSPPSSESSVLGQTEDDIQNNNNSTGPLLKIDSESGKDLIEFALGQLHGDTEEETPTTVGENTTASSSTNEPTTDISQSEIAHITEVATSSEQTTVVAAQSDLQQLDSQSSIISSSSTNMGMQKDYLKENPDMEQMLGELASTSDMELLQVFKSLEGNPSGDGLCAELAGGLSLFSDVDVGNIYEEVAQSTPPNKDRERLEMHAEIVKRQTQMQRKYDFLIRRLNKLQARYMGQHVSEEIAGLFEYSQRFWKKKDKEHAKGITSTSSTTSAISPTSLIPDIIPYQPPPPSCTDRVKPISANAMKTFVKRLEGIATTQCSTQTKRIFGNRYFQGTASTPSDTGLSSGAQHSSSVTISALSTTIPKFEDFAIDQLEQTSGMLHSELKHIQQTIDSEATASSSGGESADEMVLYNNQNQQPLTITKRATWRWAKDRGSVAARWTWLLAQISDLEYRIRQHNELHNKIKVNKGPVTLEDGPSSSQQQPPSQQSVNGYRGTLPGNSKSLDSLHDTSTGNVAPNGAYDHSGGCCRTRPFHRNGFRKRKLLQTANLHTISKKAARPSTIKCGCAWPIHPCALCTGRQDPTAPRDLPDTMPASERVALLDSCFHPVLSFPEDVSHSIHFESIMRIPEWQNKMIRCTAKSLSRSVAQKAAFFAASSSPPSGTLPSSTVPAFLSSGDEAAPSVSKKYGTEGKRKYNRHNKLHGSQDLANHKLKKSKSRRSFLMQGRGRKPSSGYSAFSTASGSQYGAAGSGAIPGGSSNKYYKSSSSKYRKTSHSSSVITPVGTTTRSHNRYSTSGANSGGYDYADSSGVQHDGTGSGSGRSKNSSPTPNHNRNERKSRTSYDIDNIVIPQSMAASNRVEILQYKEITTPKWRFVDRATDGGSVDSNLENTLLEEATNSDNLDASQITKTDSGNSTGKSCSGDSPAAVAKTASIEKQQHTSATEVKSELVVTDTPTASEEQLVVPSTIEDEDISDETILAKHERALLDERKKFQSIMKFPWSRPRANRRVDSRAPSSGGNTPDPPSPAPPTPLVDHESNTSPACPSTPLTPLDSQELSETNVINGDIDEAPFFGFDDLEMSRAHHFGPFTASRTPLKEESSEELNGANIQQQTQALNQSLTKKERRRTVSNKTVREEIRRSSTPDIKEIVPPYDSLQFPLPDDVYDEMIRQMPSDHLVLVEDAITKLTRPNRPNNNVLLENRNNLNLGISGSSRITNPLSSNLSTTSTTLSATENDLDEIDCDENEDELLQAKKIENQIIMEKLLKSCDENRMYVGPQQMLEEDDAMEDEETDTGESLFVEEDDPNDPEWYDRPGRGRT